MVAVLVAVGLISGCGHIFASARGATLAHLEVEELSEVKQMPVTIEPTERDPLVKYRTPDEWQETVLEMASDRSHSESFTYWLEAGYSNGRLTSEDARVIANFASMIEEMSHAPVNPENDARSLILGALAFAHARTNDVRRERGELPEDDFLPLRNVNRDGLTKASRGKIFRDSLKLITKP